MTQREENVEKKTRRPSPVLIVSYGLRRPLQFPYVSVERLKFGFLKEQPRVKTHSREGTKHTWNSKKTQTETNKQVIRLNDRKTGK